jgi:hypothetical protein
VGNSPCRPHSSKNRDVKEDKFAKILGTVDDMSTSLRYSSFKFVNF